MFIGKILSGVKPTHDINAAVGIPGRGDKAEAILMESIERANKDWPTRAERNATTREAVRKYARKYASPRPMDANACLTAHSGLSCGARNRERESYA